MGKNYKTDGMVIATEPANGNDFKLSELRSVVGGYIEVVALRDGLMMVVNEEGKLQNLPVNYNATTVLQNMAVNEGYKNDYVCGDALVCERHQIL